MFDLHTLQQMLLVALAGGVLGLDRTAVGQFMVSQPIVAGPLVGTLLGDGASGLIIGLVLQLVWVMDMPIGTFVPANATIMSIVATGSAVLGSAGHVAPPVLGFCLFLSTALAQLTMAADRVVRALNGRLVSDVDAAIAGDALDRRLVRAHVLGLGIFYLKSFILCAVTLPVGYAAVRIFAAAPAVLQDTAAFVLVLLPLLGSASMVRRLTVKNFDWFLLGGFCVTAAAGLVLHVPAVALPAIAAGAGWAGVKLRERRP
jgi:mannose/fructose/N-acetylgalactosamine-specific phosphotransferase system component IIC